MFKSRTVLFLLFLFVKLFILGQSATDFPTSQPSAQPSSQPSAQPSSQPSGAPSSQPSRQPSSQPSTQPSSKPTNPTSQPSSVPSSQPSCQPTQTPTNPTSQPSSSPTDEKGGRGRKEPPDSKPPPTAHKKHKKKKLRGPKAGDTTSIIAAALIGIPVVALSLGLAFFMRSRKNKLANKQTVQGTTHAPFSDLSANKESGWRDNVDCTEHLSCTGVGENVDSDASNNERIMSQSFRIKKVKEKGKSSKYVTIPESESLVI